MFQYFHVVLETTNGVLHGLQLMNSKGKRYTHSHCFTSEANLKRFASTVRSNESKVNFRKKCWLNHQKKINPFNKSLYVLPKSVGDVDIKEVFTV